MLLELHQRAINWHVPDRVSVKVAMTEPRVWSKGGDHVI